VTSSIVTQTLGGTTARRRLDPHLHSVVLEPATRLLVCSDGLTDYVHLDEIEREVLSPSSPLRVVEALLRMALVAGAPDNVSVVLAETHPDTLDQMSADTPREGSVR
jgi:serine/threonine protein phosphatase PrpC